MTLEQVKAAKPALDYDARYGDEAARGSDEVRRGRVPRPEAKGVSDAQHGCLQPPC